MTCNEIKKSLAASETIMHKLTPDQQTAMLWYLTGFLGSSEEFVTAVEYAIRHVTNKKQPETRA